MATKKVIFARFVDFDVMPTNSLPWQPDVRFSKKNIFIGKFLEINFINYLTLFYIIYHFLSE